MARTITALDLFAGTGWGVACRRLGVREMGVELMPEAVATRTANGMATIYRDVWEGLTGNLYVPRYDLLIASPPCQTFSMAGKGAGRAALDEVLEAIRVGAYKDPAELLAFGERHDMRTALVLTPLAHVWRDRPEYVALEQVPTVLPVWEACAAVMRELGYEVVVGNLHAEQYGVPQTRKRAILLARLGGPVAMPVPTHSKYYPTNPTKLDEGVQKWVSMAEALGWSGRVRLRSNYGTSGDPAARGERSLDRPAATVTSKAGRSKWDGERNLVQEEAAALQSYPVGFTQNNRLAHQAVRTLDQPAPTVTAGHDSGNRGFLDDGGNLTVATPDEVAALQSYPTHMAAAGTTHQLSDPRPVGAPAATITGGNTAEWGSRSTRASGPKDRDPSGVRLSVEESATLQSYPEEPPFVWCGTKTKVFLQIGNAVPPLLAQRILEALLAE